MNSVRNDFATRKSEAEKFIKYIDDLENLERPRSDTYISLFPDLDLLALKTTLKASCCLILYNIVESTTTNCLNKIHERIIADNLYYSQLNVHIQKILLTYYENASCQNSDITKNIDYKFELIELVENRRHIDITFLMLSQYYQMYSGNLDGKQIRNILKRYDIIFETKCSQLKTIKDNRNKLAHGEMSFEEIGRELSVQQIVSLKDKIFEYLEGLIQKVEDYLSTKKYKQNDL